MTSQTLLSDAELQVSKSLLNQEFEKIKSQILMKLERIHMNTPYGESY
jgi:hypothetical protein